MNAIINTLLFFVFMAILVLSFVAIDFYINKKVVLNNNLKNTLISELKKYNISYNIQ